MSVEMHEVGKMPKEEIIAEGKSLYEKAVKIVTQNPAFRDALVERYIVDPQNYTTPDERLRRIEFTSGGTKYTVNLQKSANYDRINLTCDDAGVDEGIRIELYYEPEELKGARTLFSKDRKVKVSDAQIIYQETRWRGTEGSQMWVDTKEAIDKINAYLDAIV